MPLPLFFPLSPWSVQHTPFAFWCQTGCISMSLVRGAGFRHSQRVFGYTWRISSRLEINLITDGDIQGEGERSWWLFSADTRQRRNTGSCCDNTSEWGNGFGETLASDRPGWKVEGARGPTHTPSPASVLGGSSERSCSTISGDNFLRRNNLHSNVARRFHSVFAYIPAGRFSDILYLLQEKYI